MTADERNDRTKRNWLKFVNASKDFSTKVSFSICFVPFNRTYIGDSYTSNFITHVNKEWRNNNKRLITYLNRKARADHMKAHGKTPKHVPTIREMYLNSK